MSKWWEQYYKNRCCRCKIKYLSMEKTEMGFCTTCSDKIQIEDEECEGKKEFIMNCLRREIETTVLGNKIVVKNHEDIQEVLLNMVYNLAEQLYEIKRETTYNMANVNWCKSEILNSFKFYERKNNEK